MLDIAFFHLGLNIDEIENQDYMFEKNRIEYLFFFEIRGLKMDFNPLSHIATFLTSYGCTSINSMNKNKKYVL